jgi:RNA polymerase sigma factor (sigma-70 family)
MPVPGVTAAGTALIELCHIACRLCDLKHRWKEHGGARKRSKPLPDTGFWSISLSAINRGNGKKNGTIKGKDAPNPVYPCGSWSANCRWLNRNYSSFFAGLRMPFSKRYFFDFLFRQHCQELLAFAGRHSNHEAAEDLVQEAYVHFIQQAETGHIENPRAYLYRITHNLSADYHRHGQVRARHAGDEDDIDSVADPQPGPEAAADAQLRLQHCLNALRALPEVYRHVFLLHRFDGLTYAEIGQALGLPSRTVERYAAKALAERRNTYGRACN